MQKINKIETEVFSFCVEVKKTQQIERKLKGKKSRNETMKKNSGQ